MKMLITISMITTIMIMMMMVQEVQMQPAYRVGREASATQPRRREQVIF